MVVNINHKKQSSKADSGDTSLIRPSDWNDTHTIDTTTLKILNALIGVNKKIKIPILIEEKVGISGQSSVTFSNLDGNNDGTYFLEFESMILACTGSGYFWMRPNNASTSIRSTTNRWWGNTGDSTSYSDRWNMMNHGANGGSVMFDGEAKVFPKNGTQRKFHSTMVDYYSTEQLMNRGFGDWSNTTDNITSIVIGSTNATFSGTIRLYKYITIDLTN